MCLGLGHPMVDPLGLSLGPCENQVLLASLSLKTPIYYDQLVL